MTTLDIMKTAKETAPVLAIANTEVKNSALSYMAQEIINHTEEILMANKKDVEAAKGKISDVMIDRLTLNQERIHAMAKGILDVEKLPDPAGEILERIQRPNGLIIEKTAVPLGVIAIIYESRPNVTADAAALALKSGNGCILRVGKEAWESANAITLAMQKGIEKAGLPRRVVQLIEDTTRESANELMAAKEYIDLLIPRGGAGLIKNCTENAKVPCIQTGTGICHIYVDQWADLDMALNIIENAKTSRPSVCNAAEDLIVNSHIATEFLPLLNERLNTRRRENPVQFRLDEKAAKVISGAKASEDDFHKEFLDYIMAVKVVDDIEEALQHIKTHSTGHSEAIITENKENAQRFIQGVDSAAVYVNASTRFTDGGEFGQGCEMGISTQKLHARGPMGLKELTTYKYVVHGTGQIR